MKMEESVKNDFFKDFRQKWEVRDGAVVFQKILVSVKILVKSSCVIR